MPKQSRKTKKTKVPAIFVEHLTVAYDDNIVLDNISFEIKKGDIAALIGPNGSGKTTLLKAILGLIPLESGNIALSGQHLHKIRNKIGYVPQKFEFDRDFPITVKEFMNLARRHGCPASQIKEKVQEVGLTPLVLDQQIGNLSGGQMQRVLIAQALINDPDILFLDEPSAGIDIAGEAVFYDIIEHLNKVHGTTIFLVSHDVSVIAKVVDTVICINKKLFCAGTPKKALTKKKIDQLFGTHTDFYEHHKH